MIHSQIHSSVLRDPRVLAFYRRRKVLVAGADGFLGFNCLCALRQLGAVVTIVTRRSSPRAGDLAGCVLRGDLRDPAIARSAVAGQELVIDLMGSSGAVESNRNPQHSLDQDCRSHLALLEACAESASLSRVLFASSRLVYGRPQYLPVDEEHPLNPESIYAAHKITVEHYLRILGSRRGLDYSIFRISNPYGPHQENNGKGYGVINQFLRQAARGEVIEIFGDGRQQRDYIHVDDVTAALLLASMNPACGGQVFNLGGSRGISLAGAASLISRLAGSEVRFVPWPLEYRVVETGDYITDMTRLSSFIRLPAPIDWEQGLAGSLEHYRRHPDSPRSQGQPADSQRLSREVLI